MEMECTEDGDAEDSAMDELKEVELQSCSRCNVPISGEAQSFDNDTCLHPVCVECRFKEDKCVICANKADSTSTPIDTNQLSSLTDFKYFKRKTFKTDHIVDVEVCEGAPFRKQMCTVCQRVFKSTNARYHYACATGDKPYSCSECPRKFVKKSHLQIHLNNHFGIKPFKCTEPKCKASFTQKDKLNRHMKTHNKAENKKSHNCPVCNKNYTSKDILKVHLVKVHSSDKTFQCDLCPRSYKYSKSLKIHRLKHQAKKSYMCETCGKKYTLAAQLKIHKRSHIPYQRRPYKCSCGCRFITRRDKLRHQLIHVTTSKDFECSLCNTTFGRKDNLERHMKNFHQDNSRISNKVTKVSTLSKSLTSRKNKDNSTVDHKSEKPGNVDKSNAKKKKNSKNKSTVLSCNNTQANLKEGVVDLSINKDNVIKSNETFPDLTKSVIPLLPSEVQNRPSVIKSVPKLLPYRILPTDKMLLDFTENSSSKQTSSKQNSNKSNEPLVTEPVSKIKPARKTKVKKDLAYDKCFRIIHHTSTIQTRQHVTNLPVERTAEINNTNPVIIKSNLLPSENYLRKKTGHSSSCVTVNTSENSLIKYSENEHSMEIVGFITAQIPGKLSGSSSSNFPGGPTLPTTLQENIDTSQEENFSNSYVPISETNDSSYTPYFESDSFRETVNNNYGDFDIGFQYENETFSYSETSSSGTPKIVKSLETKVIKHL